MAGKIKKDKKRIQILMEVEAIDLLKEFRDVTGVSISSFLTQSVMVTKPQLRKIIEAARVAKTKEQEANQLLEEAVKEKLEEGDQILMDMGISKKKKKRFSKTTAKKRASKK